MNRLLVIQQIERERPALFSKVASELGLKICTLRMYRGDPIVFPGKNDILLIMGGPMGVADITNPLYPWLAEQVEIIKYAIINNIPIIGVCLGAQLLAVANGGKCEPLIDQISKTPIKELGWSTIDFIKSSPEESIFSKLSFPFYGLHWHGDRIILPKNSILLGSTPICNEQMFRVGKFAYGIQFHIELEQNDFDRWIKEDYEFVKSGLGPMGEEILKKQKDICLKSKSNRIQLIRNLIKVVLTR